MSFIPRGSLESVLADFIPIIHTNILNNVPRFSPAQNAIAVVFENAETLYSDITFLLNNHRLLGAGLSSRALIEVSSDLAIFLATEVTARERLARKFNNSASIFLQDLLKSPEAFANSLRKKKYWYSPEYPSIAAKIKLLGQYREDAYDILSIFGHADTRMSAMTAPGAAANTERAISGFALISVIDCILMSQKLGILNMPPSLSSAIIESIDEGEYALPEILSEY
jgi:hypothetical protein